MLLVLLAGLVPEAAADNSREAGGTQTWAASFRLRGGYDSNPMLLAAPRGAAFAGIDGVAVFGRTWGDFAAGLVAEASLTGYRDATVDPVQRYGLRTHFENPRWNGIAFRSAASLRHFSNYETRLSEAEQSVRVRRAEGAVQPFASAAVRHVALNEVSPVLGEFLPDSQRFLRGTIIPGIALKHGKLEIGASVNLSATRYAERLDLFGFRRDNERVEPFLFASYGGETLSLFASLSRLHGDWHDVDFSDVRRTLFELTAEYRDGPVEIELSAMRFAADTTFPVSPISIDTEIAGKVTARLDPALRIAAFGRRLEREFLDSPFRSRRTEYGLELAKDMGETLTLAVEIARVRMQPVAGGPLHAVTAAVSMTRRYGADPDDRLRAGSRFPPARSSR